MTLLAPEIVQTSATDCGPACLAAFLASILGGLSGFGTGLVLPVFLVPVVGIVNVVPVMAVAIVPNNQIFNAYLVWGDQQFDLVFMGRRLPTTWLVWSLFILTGVLAAIASVITTARLGSGANSIGQLAELYVISAAVIGGTSFAGGIGSVPGAVLGALLIQTLDNGMVLLDVSSPMRQIFIGIVLIVSVWFDVVYQKRT